MNISHGRRKGPSLKKLVVATYSVTCGPCTPGGKRKLRSNMMINDPIDEETSFSRVGSKDRVKTKYKKCDVPYDCSTNNKWN